MALLDPSIFGGLKKCEMALSPSDFPFTYCPTEFSGGILRANYFLGLRFISKNVFSTEAQPGLCPVSVLTRRHAGPSRPGLISTSFYLYLYPPPWREDVLPPQGADEEIFPVSIQFPASRISSVRWTPNRRSHSRALTRSSPYSLYPEILPPQHC